MQYVGLYQYPTFSNRHLTPLKLQQRGTVKFALCFPSFSKNLFEQVKVIATEQYGVDHLRGLYTREPKKPVSINDAYDDWSADWAGADR